MSWEVLKPARQAKGDARESEVTVASNGAKSKFRHWLHLSIHRDAFASRLSWLKPRARVDVAIGKGEDAEKIRISDGGAFTFSELTRCGSKTSPGRYYIRLAALPQQLGMPFNSQAVTWDIVNGALILTLPGWCFGRLGDADKGAAAVGGVLMPLPELRAPTPTAPAQGGAYRLGAPSHAQVNKMRGVPGAD